MRHRAGTSLRGIALVACACTGAYLSACSVGPRFHRPSAPPDAHYTAEGLPALTAEAAGPGGAAQHFLEGQDLPRDWWKGFGSAELNALVEEAMRANPSVLAAQAVLRQANENLAAQRGIYYPNVQASFATSRQRNAVGVLAPTLNSGTALFNLFTPQVSVSYLFDVFGVNRRQVESQAALTEANGFQLDATYLTLAANVVTAAIQEAGIRDQIAGNQRIIRFERDALGILRRQLELGAIAEGDVFAQEAALAQLETTLPPLTRQLQTTHDLLAVLTGRLPAEMKASTLALDQLTLPTDIPVGVASQLVERRPDVRAAEAQLHAATAQLGVAIANLLPQITLTGGVGSSATAIGDLFKAGTGFWSLGASLTQTLFQGGVLVHHKRAADAALDQAGAQYRIVVLSAFQNVADALYALQADADALNAASRAELAASESLAVVRRQLQLGAVSELALLLAQQTSQQSEIALVQARTLRFTDTAALFQALGGSIAH